MKLLFIIFLIVTSTTAIAQEAFISKCENVSSSEFSEEQLLQIQWLKLLFNTSDCSNLAKQLGLLKSFSEIVPSERNTDGLDWANEVPEMVLSHVPTVKSKGYPKKIPKFNDLSLFSEFKNLQHIAHSLLDTGRNVCETIEQAKYIRKISLIDVEYLTPWEVECMKKRQLEVFFLRRFRSFLLDLDLTGLMVVGIEDYRDEIGKLKRFEHLKYLGIQWYDGNGSLRALATLGKLTHLRLNIQKVERLDFLKYLVNLNFLSLNCFELDSIDIYSDKPCKHSKLEDISFLAELTWLKRLDLSRNYIKDISPLRSLKNLTSLKLRSNSISKVPDLCALKRLTYLDISGNNIEDIYFLAQTTNLRFLNIANNRISDISIISQLNKIKYLILGQNPIKDLSGFSPSNQLKVLNISGDTSSSLPISEVVLDVLNSVTDKDPEEKFWFLSAIGASLEDRYQSPKQGMVKDILKNLNFGRLTGLEVLSIRDTHRGLPIDLSGLTNLQFLDYGENTLLSDQDQFPIFPKKFFPKNVVILKLNQIGLTEVPDLTIFSNLRDLDLSFNNFNENEDFQINSPHLQILNLSGTFLSSAPNLQGSRSLSTLSLSGNEIEHIVSEKLPSGLIDLEISQNKIRILPDFSHTPHLKNLNVSHNRIEDISNVTTLPSDVVIGLSNNELSDLSIFRDKRLKDSFVSINNNVVIRGEKTCPTDTLNNSIARFCSKYNSGP